MKPLSAIYPPPAVLRPLFSVIRLLINCSCLGLSSKLLSSNSLQEMTAFIWASSEDEKENCVIDFNQVTTEAMRLDESHVRIVSPEKTVSWVKGYGLRRECRAKAVTHIRRKWIRAIEPSTKRCLNMTSYAKEGAHSRFSLPI